MKAGILFALIGLALGQDWENWICSSGTLTITAPTPTQVYSASPSSNFAISSLYNPANAFQNHTTISITTSRTLSLFSVTKATNSSFVNATTPAALSEINSFRGTAQTSTPSGIIAANTVIVSPTALRPSSTGVVPSLATGAAGQSRPPTLSVFDQLPSWSSPRVATAVFVMLIVPAIEAGIWEI